MFCFVFNNKNWSPDESEIGALFGDSTKTSLVANFESIAGHPLYAILYAVEGLRVFDRGLVEVETEDIKDIPANLLENADNKFAGIFGPYSRNDVAESLTRLQEYSLTKTTIEELLSMVGLLQGIRQKMIACGNIEKWREDFESMGSTLGNAIEDLQFNKSHSLGHIIEPLKPIVSIL